MIFLLIRKDFRRTLRNPWPWFLNLALPIAVTALIGLAFGEKAGRGGGSIARLKFALVDEDKSLLSRALRSALTQEQASEHLEAIFVERAEALRVLRANEISAMVVIPTNFTARYLAGDSGLRLEVVKNPAQSFMPAIVEELSAVGVTGLNAISRNLNAEFPKLRAVLTNGFDFEKVGDAIKPMGDRLKSAKAYLDPPLVTYEKAVTESKAKTDGKNVAFSIFGFILPGMASAFLLFIADQQMRDILRETRAKTLDRQRTVGGGAGQFIAAKIIFAAMSVMLAALILFGAGSLIFGIDWGHPGLLALACAGYSLFGAGLLAAITALAPSERRSDSLNSMLLFSIAFLGGSYLPAENFPPFLRDRVTTWMPNYWLIETARTLQNANADYLPPMLAIAKLTTVGVVLGVAAAFILERKLTKGARA